MEERCNAAISNERRSEKTGNLVMSKDGQNEVECLSTLFGLMGTTCTAPNKGPEAKTLRSLATMCSAPLALPPIAHMIP